jgi:hypothetical protein
MYTFSFGCDCEGGALLFVGHTLDNEHTIAFVLRVLSIMLHQSGSGPQLEQR